MRKPLNRLLGRIVAIGTRRDFLRAAGFVLAGGLGSTLAAATAAPKAGLFLVGGPSLDHLGEPDTYHELIKRARNPGKPRVSFVTSASVIFRKKRMDEHLASFQNAGVDPKNVHVISIMKADDAPEITRDTPFAVAPEDRKALGVALEFLRHDDVVFLDGGDQNRLVPVLKSARLDADGPSAWDLLARRYREDDAFLLGGTSAGSAAMPRRMIHEDTVNLPEPAQYRGFNLPGLEGIAIDTHYDFRGRVWRFPAFMRKVGDRVGLGLPENGGIYLFDGVAEVFSVGTHEHTVAAQIHRGGVAVEKKYRPGERFALADLRAEALTG